MSSSNLLLILNLLVFLKNITEAFSIPYLQPFFQSFNFFFKNIPSPTSLLVRGPRFLNSFLEWVVQEPTVKDPERFGTLIYKLGSEQNWTMIREVPIQCMLGASRPFDKPFWRYQESGQLAPSSSIRSEPCEFSSHPWHFLYLQLFNPFIELPNVVFPHPIFLMKF